MLFENQIKYIDKIESTLFSELREAIQKYDFVIIDYVTNKQLFREGEDGNKEKLEKYKISTIKKKIRKGDPYDRTTLRNIGKFYDTLSLIARTDSFEIRSNVDYVEYLIEKYGEDILRPNNENMNDFIVNYFIPILRKI